MNRSKCYYYWRLFATLVSFGFFSVGGLLMSLTLFPFLYILPIKKQKKVRLSRGAVKQSFRFFLWFMRITHAISYEIHDQKKLSDRDGLFIVANHPTLLDVVFLIAMARAPNCVVKKELWKNPFLFCVVRASGFIQNSGDPEEMIELCEDALAQGDGLILFPEGTRTDPDGSIMMKRGFAHIALRSKKNLTPVSIHCAPISLTKKHRYYNIPLDIPPHFCIKVGQDIDVASFEDTTKEYSKNVRLLTKHLKQEFEN